MPKHSYFSLFFYWHSKLAASALWGKEKYLLNIVWKHLWRRGVVVITTAQLHSTKPELRFCAGSNPAHGVSEIRDGEDLWQWSRLEIRLKKNFENFKKSGKNERTCQLTHVQNHGHANKIRRTYARDVRELSNTGKTNVPVSLENCKQLPHTSLLTIYKCGAFFYRCNTPPWVFFTFFKWYLNFNSFFN